MNRLMSKFGLKAAVVILSVAAMLCGRPATARAGSVNFEHVPGGPQLPFLPVTTQYQATQGMSFTIGVNGAPVLANYGFPLPTAFVGQGGVFNKALPGQGLGDWFLAEGALGLFGPIKPLTVSLSSGMHRISGDILDIDLGESWDIKAFDAGNTLVDFKSIAFGDPNTGTAVATHWSLTGSGDDIVKVVLSYTGTKHELVGVGFDNFHTSSVCRDGGPAVPLPPAVWQGLIGLAPIAGAAIRRRKLA
jgi:hypothetical protein